MSDFIQVAEHTYYFNWPAKVGFYVTGHNEVYLIDSGNDKSAGRKVQKKIEGQGWTLKAILNTHSHADHIGGNKLLQDRLGCPVYGPKMEVYFIESPILEPVYLYGGSPLEELKNKFLFAQESKPQPIEEAKLPEGFEYVYINGHSFAMIAIKTPDNIWFVADSVASERTLAKYHVPFLYDVAESFHTFDILTTLQGELFVPSHAEPTTDLTELITFNRKKMEEVLEILCDFCKQPLLFDELLKKIFDHYQLRLDLAQYGLVGNTIRSYLSYLSKEGKITTEIAENLIYWKTID